MEGAGTGVLVMCSLGEGEECELVDGEGWVGRWAAS